MHHPEYVLENETYKPLWNIVIQTEHLITASKPHLVIINKKRNLLFRLITKWNFWKRKVGHVPWPCKGIEKTVEHDNDVDSNCNWCSWYSYQVIGTRIWGLGNRRTSRVHPIYSSIKIDQNFEKSPWDMRWLATSQTPVRNHWLTLVWKTLKNVKYQ